MDQIADLLTRIRNASLIGKLEVTMPSSKMKVVILEILKKEGYISDFKSVDKKDQKYLQISISMRKRPTHLRQISKPGQRIYAKSTEIPRPLRGMGLVLISTSSGVISGREAIKRGLGGELICEVW
jgi:small subunit ribosomal protein S8